MFFCVNSAPPPLLLTRAVLANSLPGINDQGCSTVKKTKQTKNSNNRRGRLKKTKCLCTKTQSGRFVWEGKLPTLHLWKILKMTEPLLPLDTKQWLSYTSKIALSLHASCCSALTKPLSQKGFFFLPSCKHTHAAVVFQSPLRAKTMWGLCLWARTRAALRLREQLAAPSNIHERDEETVKDSMDLGIQKARWIRTVWAFKG